MTLIVSFNRKLARTRFQRPGFLPNHSQRGSIFPKAGRAAFRRAGVTDVSSHNLRKTFATRLLSRGAAITDVQHLLGVLAQRIFRFTILTVTFGIDERYCILQPGTLNNSFSKATLLANPQPPQIHLPRGWQDCVKSAVLHAIALAHYAIVYARARAADSINARVRLAAENDCLHEECALLRDQHLLGHASVKTTEKAYAAFVKNERFKQTIDLLDWPVSPKVKIVR